MPNWEEDDNSTDSGFPPGSARQTIDRCGVCDCEVDTTGDPSPKCPYCGSAHWHFIPSLVDWCPYGNPGCAGQLESVTKHVCGACLDCIAVHERTARAELFCLCLVCNPTQTIPLEARDRAEPPRPKPKNPFDDDIDDWL
jgi:hypothetical protein